MTEAQWLKAVNSSVMLAAVRDKGSDRIWRLLAVACCRSCEDRLRYRGSRKALDVAERFADGTASRTDLRTARAEAEEAAKQAHRDEWEDEVRANFRLDEEYLAVCASMHAADAVLSCVMEIPQADHIPEDLMLPDLLREIFGNPFQWKECDPAWIVWSDGTVRRLAETIYTDKSWNLLPVLADALEEAGCTDADILSHCRGPGPHVRGCWVIDLLLGKN